MDNSTENNQLDTTMDKVVQHIYPSCDLDQTNSVSVSKLIEFVKPYLTDNLSELDDLRKKLDPNDSNPNITQETFHTTLNEWCNKIKQSTKEDPFFRDFDKDLSFIQSTPRQSLENQHNEMFNLSTNSEIETINNNSTSEMDRIIDLEQQLTKMARELQLTKQQLVTAEEQNESMSSDLNKRSQQLQESKQLIKQLKNNKFENDELIDEIDSLKRKIRNLEQQLSEGNKEQCQYVDKIQTLENKKLYLQNQLILIQKHKQEFDKQIVEMTDVIYSKDDEISLIREITEKLNIELEEKNNLITFHQNEIEVLKHKIVNFEELLDERTMKNESIQTLMEQLNNPVTPILNTPNGLENYQNNYRNLSQISTPNMDNTTGLYDEGANISPLLADLEFPPRFLPDDICQASNFLTTYEDNIKEDLCKKQEELIEKLKNQNKEYIDKVESYRNDHLTLQNSYDELTVKYNVIEKKNQNLQSKINDYKNSNFNKQQIKIDRLEERIDELKQDLHLEKNSNKKLSDTIVMRDETIKQLSDELDSQRVHFDEITNGTIQNLDGIILTIRNLHLNNTMGIIVDSNSSDQSNLQNQTRMLRELLELLINKYQELLHDYDEMNKIETEILNQMVFPSESDEFLQNVELEQDIEKQFEILELNFTINFKTTQERFNKQKQRYNKLIQKFLQNIDKSLHLLRTNNQNDLINTVLINLEHIKNDFWKIITTIERCGNLEYEIRIMKCWDLIINYIEILRCGNVDDSHDFCFRTNGDIGFRRIVEKSSNNRRNSRFPRMCEIVCQFVLFLFLLYSLIIIYIHMKCDGKIRICPLDGIFSKFVQYNISTKY